MAQSQQVPRETARLVSQSVISSSNINQGDREAATSSSSSTEATATATASTLTPSRDLFIPYPSLYASISDINCSSNIKTSLGGSTSTNYDNIAGYTNANCEQDWTQSANNANLDAIHSSECLKAPNYQPTSACPSACDTIDGPASNKGWGIPKGMGLRGGGENSLNAGTSGWGTPPAAGGAGWGGAAPGPAQGQWGANRPPGPAANTNPTATGAEFNGQNKPSNGTPSSAAAATTSASATPGGGAGSTVAAPASAQPPAASSATTPASGNTSWAQAAGKGLPQGPTPAQNSATKQIEQLNSMREALFAQDGWGGQHVNQDTSWDTPGSPEPAKGDPAATTAPLWKQNVNNGTDLWEANLRNGGQPSAQPQNKTPWGHTPTTNIGGTWGEEDEGSDACNVWTGPSGAPAAPGAQGSWPGAPPGPWPEKKPEWGAGPGGSAVTPTGSQWGDPRTVPPMDPRDPRADPNNLPLNDMNLMRMRNEGGVMRGDPRGVSGRLNNTEQMWAAHQPPPTPKLAGLPPGGNQWSSGLPKDMGGMVNAPGKPSGWEEPSPPAQRRNIPNYDDGTSLWGQQQTRLPQPAPVAPNKNLSHWDKLPGNNMIRGNMPCPTGMPGTRMPGAATVKPDGAPVWGQGRNGAWDHDGGWGDDSKLAGNWPNESPLTPPSWQGSKPGGKPAGWGDDVADGSAWVHPSMQRPNVPKLSSDIIYASKQFRTLCEMNYKKEDVETALRSTNMSLPEAMELLGTWGRREEHPFDQSMLRGAGFPVQPLGFTGGPGNGANNPALNLNKMNLMAQGQAGQSGLVAGQGRPGAAQPSAQQLKLLIQQIQMAVQTGYLNHQILNQPLAPPTLVLVNQLLQQIKLLHQLNQRHQMLQMSGSQLKGNAAMLASLSLQMAKTKQNIQNFQSQITGHQANYMKQQQQSQQLGLQTDSTSDLFKSSFTDPLATLSNFPDLSISDKTSMPSTFQTQSQSRLTQWKLPSLDKEGEASEFSRAPGSAKGHTTNLTETWSAGGGRGSDGGWPDSTTNDLSDKESQWSTSQSNSIADFIPEFEPGKPWKGTQMKTVEDDPSMTPGSVARSPLAMAAIKDTDILSDSNKTSPGPQTSGPGQDSAALTSLGLSSSPWTSLNSGTSSVYTSPLSKLTSSKSWADSTPASQGAELWLSASGKTARGPPPGLGAKLGHTQPNWTGAGSRSSWGASPSSWGSPWLILRNLTPQIDGSTLKTLCMQHGPLQSFHLHLNVGTALAKYSSREEANKAQQALNNCVLGNTTIFAESPGESEVATLLNQLGHSNPPNNQQQNNWNIRTSQPQTNPSKTNDAWATSAGSLPGYAGSGNLWQNTGSSGSLWGSDGDAHRSTPSGASLNSFLPPDLLSGETI